MKLQACLPGMRKEGRPDPVPGRSLLFLPELPEVMFADPAKCSAAPDGGEQFITRRVENFEGLVVFSDLRQPGLFAW